GVDHDIVGSRGRGAAAPVRGLLPVSVHAEEPAEGRHDDLHDRRCARMAPWARRLPDRMARATADRVRNDSARATAVEGLQRFLSAPLAVVLWPRLHPPRGRLVRPCLVIAVAAEDVDHETMLATAYAVEHDSTERRRHGIEHMLHGHILHPGRHVGRPGYR